MAVVKSKKTVNAGNSGDKMKNIQAKVDGFVSRFRLGTHYTIERVAIVSGAAVVTGAMLLSGTVVYAVQAGNVDFSQTAMYGDKFTTSRTGQTGAVTGFWSNADQTRAFVMMKFDMPANASTNVNDYYAFVAGVDDIGRTPTPSDVAQATAGSLYSFGDGYIGLMLEAPEGFDMQVLNVTMRAEKELAEVDTANLTPENLKAQMWDESFVDNDQWSLMINPAAEMLSYLPALDGDSVNLRELYWQTSFNAEEGDRRQTADTSLAKMHALQGRINSYTEALDTTFASLGGDRVTLLPPGVHELIRGDRIEGMSSVDVRRELEADPSGATIPGWTEKTEAAVLLDSSGDYEYNTYSLVTEHVAGGGYDFDWRSRTMLDGYLDSVVPGGQNPMTWITDHAYQTKPTWNSKNEDWVLSNGDLLEDHVTTPGAKPLVDLKNNLSQAYQDYFNEKVNYQRVTLQQMLIAEAQLDQAVDNIQVARGSGAVEFRL